MYTCSNLASFSMTIVLSRALLATLARCPAAVLRLFLARLFGLRLCCRWGCLFLSHYLLTGLSRAVLALLPLPAAFSACNKMPLCSSFSLRTIAEPFDRSPDIRYTSFRSFTCFFASVILSTLTNSNPVLRLLQTLLDLVYHFSGGLFKSRDELADTFNQLSTPA